MWEQSEVFPEWPPGWSLGAEGKLLRWETPPSRIRAPGKGGRGPLQREGTCSKPPSWMGRGRIRHSGLRVAPALHLSTGCIT